MTFRPRWPEFAFSFESASRCVTGTCPAGVFGFPHSTLAGPLHQADQVRFVESEDGGVIVAIIKSSERETACVKCAHFTPASGWVPNSRCAAYVDAVSGEFTDAGLARSLHCCGNDFQPKDAASPGLAKRSSE